MDKIWVIPDTHGCVLTLKILIENQIEPDKKDKLIFVGDYIDRGPDSKGVIDYIMNMEKQGYDIITLMGNHEDYCITAWEDDQDAKSFLGIRPKTKTQKEWEMYGGVQTLESFGVDRPRDIPMVYIDWMKKLEYYVEVSDFIIVHAGFNFDLEDPFEDRFSMIWIREFTTDLKKINNKTIIHGHVPVNLEYIDMAIKAKGPRVIDIDNGIYFINMPGYGNLVALELTKMEYAVQSVMDEVTFNNKNTWRR
ncbi:MAG TPA: serine/threonine protein phosphatase [Bacteroidetes bacterium]|nr:serine/threonine protein phosphatase [Bacteroidota bacterium]